MVNQDQSAGILAPYRVLDLTDENGLLCGKLLGDLGAEVIKVEKPGGDPSRLRGPFYHDDVDPEKGLFWWAFNTSKKSVTLDLSTVKGRNVFKRMAKVSDFVVESFSPGYMDKLGLGYAALEEINPGIIMVSITPFGQTGPYRDYKSSDIVTWAMGGEMYVSGHADSAPVRMSHHSQSSLNASVDAAVGALIALHNRRLTGAGQHVDTSIQESVHNSTYIVTPEWDMRRGIRGRGSQHQKHLRSRTLWRCKDGYVIFIYWFGLQGSWNLPLIKWMEEEKASDPFLSSFEWTVDPIKVNQEAVDRFEEPIAKFFLARTKSELLQGALKHRARLYHVATAKDIVESVQLAARKFWVEIEHTEVGAVVKYPGLFFRSSESTPNISLRAPLVGEHNSEVFEKLGSSAGTPSSLEPRKSQPETAQPNPARNPLQGVKVLDFSWLIAGPLTTKPLSDYGAMVIKVEGRSRADPIRSSTPPYKDDIPGMNRSGIFNQYNTGKLSIALNLSKPKGIAVAKRLAAWADIVVENFAGGVMQRMGLGYEELRKVNPGVIMLSSCMQGQTGPYANHPGTGFHLTALSGMNQITGWPDREPIGPDGPYTDYIAPRFSTLAILAALEYRQQTGKGQYIDISQYESGAQFMAPLVLDYLLNKREAGRMGNHSLDAVPHNAYRCLGNDRWCAICVSTDDEWARFCNVVGNPDRSRDERFASFSARKNNEDELDKWIEQWTISRTAEDVMTSMQAAGVAAGVLQTGEDLMEHDPQLKYRGFFSELDHPEAGKYRAPRPAFILSKTPCELKRAPLLGEHNEYVLKEILNMSDEEIAGLVIEEVIEVE